jgi:nitroreductase
MDVFEAIRTRRTHKAYRPEPVDRDTLLELLELARWGAQPSRHRAVALPACSARTPWRGSRRPRGEEAAAKLDRAPTLIAASQVRDRDDPVADEEDFAAAVIASYLVCSARTPAAWPGTGARRRSSAPPRGRAALGSATASGVLGLLHLGSPRQQQRAPERAPVEAYARFLD